jgi:O-antigen/teichoic acid export membrane protein
MGKRDKDAESVARSARERPRTQDRAGQRSYGAGARILSLGIASTGLLTFAYFSIASHVLGEGSAKLLDVLWSVMFVIISVIYRPIEQLLSRTIAERRARGQAEHTLRVPMLIQASFALIFLAVALALHDQLVDHVFEGQQALYDVLIVGTLAYAASYFARGWLAGHQRFGLFGGLVLMESTSRLSFAIAVALGIASGQTAVALGIAAAPFVSLVVVPAAFAKAKPARPERAAASAAPDEVREQVSVSPLDRALGGPVDAEGQTLITVDEADAALAGPGTEAVQETAAHDELSLRRGGGFAVWVSSIMLSEQTLLNAAVLTVDATSHNTALAGIVFNVLLIARAPLQLFQAVQTSLLPHLTGLETTAGHDAFARAIRVTILAITAFAAAVALGLLAIGPFALEHVFFGQTFTYNRFGLALIGVGMGLHLTSGALNQAALARDRARAAAGCWVCAAVAFLVWMLLAPIGEQLLRAEIGYAGATALLALLLAALYRRGKAAGGWDSIQSETGSAASTDAAIAR